MITDIYGEAHPWDNEDADWFSPLWEKGLESIRENPLNFGHTSMLWPSWRCPLCGWTCADDTLRLVEASAWSHLISDHRFVSKRGKA